MPFDLEDAYSSAFLLHLLRVISPSLLPDNGWRDDINHILQHMVDNGSVVAPLRQQELQQLERTLESITPRYSGPPDPSGLDPGDDTQWPVPEYVDEPDRDFTAMDCLEPSSNALLDWADQLDMPDFLAAMDCGFGGGAGGS